MPTGQPSGDGRVSTGSHGGVARTRSTDFRRDRDEHGRPANARPRDRFGRPLPRGAPDEMADRVEPEQAVDSLDEALQRAGELFDAERFFEAHEFLEHIWKADEIADEDRGFWKGVTQVAVGLCHCQRGNDSGARTLLGRAAAQLDAYPSPYAGVRTGTLSTGARDVLAQIDRHGPSPGLDFPRLPLE